MLVSQQTFSSVHLRLPQPGAVKPAAGTRSGRNVEVMWLVGRLVPNHKTIADFRKDNGGAIKKVCARFVELYRRMGLLSIASVAIDGSKFKAVNNPDKNFKRESRAVAQAIGREHIAVSGKARHRRSAISVGDAHVKEGADQGETRELKSEMVKLAAIEQQVLAAPDQQIALTDPDSRSMATSAVVGYNEQTAVDTEHHPIVGHEVTNVGNDTAHLSNVAVQSK